MPDVCLKIARSGLLGIALYAVGAFDTLALAQLEEIVVTARKREEPLQQTPISITAFTAEHIERPGLDDMTDIGRFTPNMVFDQGAGNSGSSNNAQVFIRGVGQVDFLFSTDPGVGIYVDDIYFPRVTGSIFDLIDMERIEILRGPQGTLFGKNTIGGAINIVSKRPGDEFGGGAAVTAGSHERIDFKGSLDLPMIDDLLAARVSVSSRNQDGYVDRVLENDSAQGDVNTDAVRVQLRWTPGDWDIGFFGDYTRGREEAIAHEILDVDASSAPLLQLWNAFVAPGIGPGVAYDHRYVSSDFNSQATGPSFSDLDMWGASLSILRPLYGGIEFKSITAYRETAADFGMDQDHSPLDYLQSTNDNDHDQFSQELQLNGVSGNGRLDWVVGAFYMKESGTDVFDLALGAGLYDALEVLPAAVVPLAPGVTCPPPPGVPAPCAGGAANPVNISLDFEFTIFDQIDIESRAIYAQSTYDLTERLSITAGARYTEEEKQFSAMVTRNAAGVTTLPRSSTSDDWSDFTPRVGLQYQWTPTLMTYVSVAEGFKSGGFNGRAQTIAEIDSFNPEYVWSYEAGIKSEWYDRRLMVNIAAFYNDYTDVQLTSVRAIDGLIIAVTENAGEAEMAGFELEFAAAPSDAFTIRGGLGYLDAKFTELAPGATVTLDTELVKTPEWTASLATAYEWPLGEAGFITLAADASYRSEFFNETTNLPMLKQDAYTLVGAHATFRSASERWSLTAFGTNLSDERYMTNGVHALESFGTVDATYGRPREYGLTFDVSF